MRTHVISSRLNLLVFSLLLLLLTACGQDTSPTGASSNVTPTAATAVDAYGTPIDIPKTAPQRIVSLVPSTAEMLGALKLQKRVVAVSYYTTYPTDIAALPKISDANSIINVEKVVALKPDLVLSYGGETKKYDTQLKQLGLRVVDLQTGNLSLVLQQILLVGRLTSTEDTAAAVVKQLQQRIDHIQSIVAGTTSPKSLLEVDYSSPGKPYIFGGGSFGDELLQKAHASNIFHDNTSNGGYPQVTDEAIIRANPQYIILTEDPNYGGKPEAVYKRANWGNIDAVKAHHVYYVNVNITQHPSQRLVDGLQCLAQIVHPDKFSTPLPDYCSASI